MYPLKELVTNQRNFLELITSDDKLKLVTKENSWNM